MYLKALVVGPTLEASNGNKYKVVAFQELSQFVKLPSGTREVKSNAKPAKRTLWEGNDGLFDNFVVDDVTMGEIKKFDVKPYEIATEGEEARTVSTFTGVQFKNESDAMTCKKYGHVLASEEDDVQEEEIIANKIAIDQPAVEVGAEIPV